MTNKTESEKICASCGSGRLEHRKVQRQIVVPFASPISFEASISKCLDCEFESESVDDVELGRMLDGAKKASVHSMLHKLSESSRHGMAHIERALGLPARTIMRWKGGDISAGALALLRLVATFPWLIEVADSGFDPVIARQKLAQEGVNEELTIVNRQAIQPATIADRIAAYDFHLLRSSFSSWQAKSFWRDGESRSNHTRDFFFESSNEPVNPVEAKINALLGNK